MLTLDLDLAASAARRGDWHTLNEMTRGRPAPRGHLSWLAWATAQQPPDYETLAANARIGKLAAILESQAELEADCPHAVLRSAGHEVAHVLHARIRLGPPCQHWDPRRDWRLSRLDCKTFIAPGKSIRHGQAFMTLPPMASAADVLAILAAGEAGERIVMNSQHIASFGIVRLLPIISTDGDRAGAAEALGLPAKLDARDPRWLDAVDEAEANLLPHGDGFMAGALALRRAGTLEADDLWRAMKPYQSW